MTDDAQQASAPKRGDLCRKNDIETCTLAQRIELKTT